MPFDYLLSMVKGGGGGEGAAAAARAVVPKFNRNFVTLIDWGEMKGTPPVLNLETDLTVPCPRPAIPPMPPIPPIPPLP